jgi:hypothetical protein
VIAVTLALVVGLAPVVVRRFVVSRASERGIELTGFSLGFDTSRLVLDDVRFSLQGVPGVLGSASRIVVALDGLEPTGAALEGSSLAIADARALPALVAWQRAHAAEAIPVKATGFSVRLVAAEDGPALATMRGDLVSEGHRVTVDGALLEALGRRVGPARVALRFDPNAVTMDIGRSGAPSSTPALTVTLGGTAPARLHVALAPIAASELAAALGLSTKLGATVQASLDTELPDLARDVPPAGAPLSATVDATLRGFVPPHPKELDGIVFGDRTEVHATIRARDLAKAELSDVRLVAGALALAGTGSVEPSSGGARVRLDLAGSLPCSELATSAASAHLSPVLAALAGNLAKRALGGSVAVHLFVDADSQNPAAARVDPSAVVKCRLGP